ncbi:MAG: hypothetical protein O2884_04760 [Chloroflexi bacterium]|nr:hypothetical protein [Chloroflexota bacterium]
MTTTSNLTWTTPREWQAPLSLTNTRGQQGGNTASLSQSVYVSWAITNTGPFTLNRPFDIHLYLDDVFLNSWRPTGQSVDFFSFVDDWDELASHIRLTPGDHTLKLVIDPYEEIPETDETDNVYELPVSITGGLTPRPGTRLPDIAPVALDGWDGPLVFNSYDGRTINGPLSTDSTTYVSFAAENVGVSSALTMVLPPTPPAPVTLPNLVPHWNFATDGPIVVSSAEDTSTHNPIVSGQPAYVDISVQNLSLVDAGSFSSSLYLDDELVETLRASDGLVRNASSRGPASDLHRCRDRHSDRQPAQCG